LSLTSLVEQQGSDGNEKAAHVLVDKCHEEQLLMFGDMVVCTVAQAITSFVYVSLGPILHRNG